MYTNFIIFNAVQINKDALSSINRNLLEYFGVFLRTGYLSILQKKIRQAFTYDTNIEYQT